MKLRIVKRANGLYSTQRKIGFFDEWRDLCCSYDDFTDDQEVDKKEYNYEDQYPLYVAEKVYKRIDFEYMKEYNKRIIEVVK